jgi:hypothetical protein
MRFLTVEIKLDQGKSLPTDFKLVVRKRQILLENLMSFFQISFSAAICQEQRRLVTKNFGGAET